MASKFEYDTFYGGYDCFAVNKDKYTKEEAIALFKKEHCYSKREYLAIGNGYVRHRVGRNEDNEPCAGWFLEYEKHKRSCPCYIFHHTNDVNEQHSKDYEYMEVCKNG